MKIKKVILFILVFPIALILDFILYAFLKSCPSCGSFSQWVQSEGAFSFPLVVDTMEYFQRLLRLPRSLKE